MHILFLQIAILTMYTLTLVELMLFPLPSEAATWSARRPGVQNDRESGRPVTALGHFATLCFFLSPLVWMFFPEVVQYLLMLTRAQAPLRYCAASVLLLAGSGMTFYAVLDLYRFKTEEKPGGGVKTDGAYRFSRNPQVLGQHLAGAGILCAFPGFIMFLLFAVYAVHIHMKITIEERYLERSHGAQYARYRMRTGRYLGPFSPTHVMRGLNTSPSHPSYSRASKRCQKKLSSPR